MIRNDKKQILFFVLLFLLLGIIVFLPIPKEKYHVPTDYHELIREKEYYQEKYESLKQELDIQDNVSFKKTYAKILDRDTYHFWDTITINKGETHGFRKGMAVISENTLVGVIDEVRSKTASVKLITKKNDKISITIGGAYGFLSASSNGELQCKNLTHYNNIKIGDKVYTSGIGLLPGKILIGMVDEIEEDTLGIEPYIHIRSNINLQDIQFVAVLEGEKL